MRLQFVEAAAAAAKAREVIVLQSVQRTAGAWPAASLRFFLTSLFWMLFATFCVGT